MPVKAVVLYPNESDIHFDMSYYLKTHMPLVEKHWKQYGLLDWEITQFEEGLGGAKPAFAVQAVLTFNSPEDVQKAVSAPEAKDVFGDVPNFTNMQPTFLTGPVKGSN